MYVCVQPLDQTTSTRLSISTVFEFQTSDVSRALTRWCCLPVEKEAPGMRLWVRSFGTIPE